MVRGTASNETEEEQAPQSTRVDNNIPPIMHLQRQATHIKFKGDDQEETEALYITLAQLAKQHQAGNTLDAIKLARKLANATTSAERAAMRAAVGDFHALEDSKKSSDELFTLLIIAFDNNSETARNIKTQMNNRHYDAESMNGDGVSALAYILGRHNSKANPELASANMTKYRELVGNGELITDCNGFVKLVADAEILRAKLTGTFGEISTLTFIQDLNRLVTDKGNDYDIAIKLKTVNWGMDDYKDLTTNVEMLESVITDMEMARAREERAAHSRALFAQTMPQPPSPATSNARIDEITAIVNAINTGRRGGGPTRKRCDACGVSGHDKDDCYSLKISKGVACPEVDQMTPDARGRVMSRAEDIKTKGLHKDRDRAGNNRARGNNGDASVKALLAALTMMGTLPGGAGMPAKPTVDHLPSTVYTIRDNTTARMTALAATAATRDGGDFMLIDSGLITQAGKPSFHIFKDINYFVNLNNHGTAVRVADNNTQTTSGRGIAAYVATDYISGDEVTVIQQDSELAPWATCNLASVKAYEQNGSNVMFKDGHRIELASGTSLHFNPDDYTLRIRPVDTDTMHQLRSSIGEQACTVQPLTHSNEIVRGKHGKIHLSTEASDQQQAETRLWIARLNDPGAERTKRLHNIMHNVPQSLRNVTMNDVKTMADMRANAPKQPTRPTTDATRRGIADTPGALTQMDHWSTGGVTGILGSTGVFAFVDYVSGHTRFLCCKSKSEVNTLVRTYYLMAAHDGVDIPAGSILYSDNEPNHKSRRLHNLTMDMGLLDTLPLWARLCCCSCC